MLHSLNCHHAPVGGIVVAVVNTHIPKTLEQLFNLPFYKHVAIPKSCVIKQMQLRQPASAALIIINNKNEILQYYLT